MTRHSGPFSTALIQVNTYLQEHWLLAVVPCKTTLQSLRGACAAFGPSSEAVQASELPRPLWDSGTSDLPCLPGLLCPSGPGLQTAFPRLCLGSASGGIRGKLEAVSWKEPEYCSVSTPPSAAFPASTVSPSRPSISLLPVSFSVSIFLWPSFPSLPFSLIPFPHVCLT